MSQITFYSLKADRTSDELRAMLSWHPHEEVPMQGNAAAYRELKLQQRVPPAVIIRRNGTPWVIASGPGAPMVLAEALQELGRAAA